MLIETWKPLPFPYYELSNLGRVRSLPRTIIAKNSMVMHFPGRILKKRTNKIEPHQFVDINVTDPYTGIKRRKSLYLHKAVAELFVPKPRKNRRKYLYVTHIKPNYNNNREDNVKWITHKELMQRQPRRRADPTKAWRTRRKKYGKSGSPTPGRPRKRNRAIW